MKWALKAIIMVVLENMVFVLLSIVGLCLVFLALASCALRFRGKDDQGGIYHS